MWSIIADAAAPSYLESSMAFLKSCLVWGGLFVRCLRKNFSPNSISRSYSYWGFSYISEFTCFVKYLKRLITLFELSVPTGRWVIMKFPSLSGSSIDTATIILRILLIPLSMLGLRLRIIEHGGKVFSVLNKPVNVKLVMRCSTEPSIANPLARS